MSSVSPDHTLIAKERAALIKGFSKELRERFNDEAIARWSDRKVQAMYDAEHPEANDG